MISSKRAKILFHKVAKFYNLTFVWCGFCLDKSQTWTCCQEIAFKLGKFSDLNAVLQAVLKDFFYLVPLKNLISGKLSLNTFENMTNSHN